MFHPHDNLPVSLFKRHSSRQLGMNIAVSKKNFPTIKCEDQVEKALRLLLENLILRAEKKLRL